MRARAAVLALALAGCSSYRPAEEYQWSIEAPPRVDPGADLVFKVKTMMRSVRPPAKEGEEPEVKEREVAGVPYTFVVVWPGGSAAPLPRSGRAGEEKKVRARVQKGKATLLVHAGDKEGRSVKVAEATFEVP
jgi:hypothetical protein